MVLSDKEYLDIVRGKKTEKLKEQSKEKKEEKKNEEDLFEIFFLDKILH